MQEGISDQLPDPAVKDHQRRHQAEMNVDPAARTVDENAQQRNRRKTTPLAMSSCFTARVNGGKLKPMLEVRRIVRHFLAAMHQPAHLP